MEKVNYHRQVMDIIDKCENDIITLVNENGGEIEVPYDDDANLDLELPCYDSNGDTYYTTITKVKVRQNSHREDYLELETNVGGCYPTTRFADIAMVYLYEHLWKITH